MESVLIANRGEIAVRVIRAARDLGMRTIAVYSELDRDAVHVELADEAWNVGTAPAAESYLNVARILEVAREAGAEAVHPGYGFLAESAAFARAVIDAGLIWVGPPAEAIAMMGDKIASRRTASAAGVPGVPGTDQPLQSTAEVEAFAAEHGYPIAIKASAGGGGRGLKVVRDATDLNPAVDGARREAEAWFGDPAVYVERYLDKARHIEAQVLFDQHGTGLYLGERDCSLQRRHQKLIEESPAVGFSAEQRAIHADHSLAVAKAAGYVNAGTVEFLMDADGSLYFLEMNTRIQVEHAVTEMATGIDLVTEQLRIAAGEKLSMSEAPQALGHAIEFRINAEDPARGFQPSPGTLVKYREPAGPGIRVDSGVRQGSTISQYYDNMIAKLIVWGRDRDEALRRAKRALEEFEILGVPTSIPAHLAILASPQFRSGEVHTRLVEQDLDFSSITTPTAPAVPEEEEREEQTMTVEVGGRRFQVRFWAPVLAVGSGGQRATPRRRPPKLQRQVAAASGEGVVTSPMQGTIVKVHKKAGDSVRAGEPVCVLEAMKMENEIKSPSDGAIVECRVQPGDTVSTGTVLMVIR